MKEQVQLLQLSLDEFREVISEVVQEQIQHLGEEQLMTRKEAAETLSISLPSLWKYTKEGSLTAYAIGERVYYKRSELILAAKRVDNPSKRERRKQFAVPT